MGRGPAGLTRLRSVTGVRILLVAPSCDGTDVGEAWVAFQWARRLSERHDVTLLTYRGRDRPSAVEQLPSTRVVEWTQPAVLGRAPRLNSLMKPWYPLFHAHCRRWTAAALRRGERFDVGHQPVPVAMRYPSPLRGSGVPYVLGPLGGSIATPAGFVDEDTAPWYVGLRKADTWRLRHDPILRRSLQEAAAVLAIAPYAEPGLRSAGVREVRFLSETAVANVPPPVRREASPTPLRLLFVGRVIRTKGLRDAIRALEGLSDLPLVLDVVGDGFDRPECQRLALRLGLGQRVRFHGALPRAAVDRFYERADVFVFPSYREPGGNVPFEAMAWGLPLVVADAGGPGHVVKDHFGVRVAVTDPTRFASDLSRAIRGLATDPARRLAMGEAARTEALRSGTWAARVEQMETVYDEVVSAAAMRPAARSPLP